MDARARAGSESVMSRKLLHVGCGLKKAATRPYVFRSAEWKEIRLDIEPVVRPDIVGDVTGLGLAADSVDGIWSSHNLEHVYAHEVPTVLGEFHRVLKLGGILCLQMPDLQTVGVYLAAGKLETKLWDSPSGPIYPLDVIYGHRDSVAQGATAMAHKTGFGAASLAKQVVGSGFERVKVARVLQRAELQVLGHKGERPSRQTEVEVRTYGELPVPVTT